MIRRFSSLMLPTSMLLAGLTILYIPILTLVIYSFVDFNTGHGPNLVAYRHLLNNEQLLDALRASLFIGSASASLSTLVGGAAAYGFERGRPRGRELFNSLSLAPMFLPEVVFGLGLLTWFVFLRISLGTVSLILAHVTFSITYVAITVRGSVKSLDCLIDDAAIDLGASPWQSWIKIKLPLMSPALISGWLMAFTLSFDDFLISFFTSGPDTITLPMALYSVIRFGVSPEVFAMSTIIFVMSFISAMIVTRLSKNRIMVH